MGHIVTVCCLFNPGTKAGWGLNLYGYSIPLIQQPVELV